MNTVNYRIYERFKSSGCWCHYLDPNIYKNDYVYVKTDHFYIYQFKQRISKVRRVSYHFMKCLKQFMGYNRVKVLFITLTFKNEEIFKSSYRNGYALRDYMNKLSMWAKRHGVKLYGYFWVLEMQARGVPHYHIVLIVRDKDRIPYPDKSYWSFGMSNVKRLDLQRFSVNYLSKYFEKKEQKDIILHYLFEIKGLKLYGCSIKGKLNDFFFEFLISRYNRFRRGLCRIFNRIIYKRKGYYDLPIGFVKLRYYFIIDMFFVYIFFECIEFYDRDMKLRGVYSSYEDLFESLKLV